MDARPRRSTAAAWCRSSGERVGAIRRSSSRASPSDSAWSGLGYVPSFCLNYFRISGERGPVAVEYRTIEKKPPEELSLLQRVIASRTRQDAPEPIPERALLNV
jgi:hypothetical protein